MRLGETYDNRVREAVIEGFRQVLIALTIYSVLSLFITTARISGNSMEPNYQSGDIVLVNKLAYKDNLPSYGDVVVAYTSIEGGVLIIKRVIGLENDTVKIKDGQVYRNGEIIHEDYIRDDYTSGAVEQTIAEEEIYLLGDNRLSSMDSRDPSVGTISIQDVLGKVSIKIIPKIRLFGERSKNTW